MTFDHETMPDVSKQDGATKELNHPEPDFSASDIKLVLEQLIVQADANLPAPPIQLRAQCDLPALLDCILAAPLIDQPSCQFKAAQLNCQLTGRAYGEGEYLLIQNLNLESDVAFSTLSFSTLKRIAAKVLRSMLDTGHASASLHRARKVDLSGLDCTGVRLNELDLSRSRLSHTTLNHADLSGTRLGYATLRAANLESANLANTKLYFTNLDLANLDHADLRNAILDGSTFNQAQCNHVNFSNADASHARFNRASLRAANLAGTRLDAADLRQANLSGAILTGANLCRADLREAVLVDAYMRGVSIAGANFAKAKLDGTQIELALPKWDDDALQKYLGDISAAGSGLLGAIESIDNQYRATKLNLMHQLADSLNDVDIASVRHALFQVWLNNPVYPRILTIAIVGCPLSHIGVAAVT